LSFFGLKATVASRCGQWPRDLAVGNGPIEDWDNKPYWNFGCAFQTALAAQVADPRDLVSPQAETPQDTVIRTGAIDALRSAIGRNSPDRGPNWKPVPSGISTIGGY
jgi:pilus assembly protein CpaD